MGFVSVAGIVAFLHCLVAVYTYHCLVAVYLIHRFYQRRFAVGFTLHRLQFVSYTECNFFCFYFSALSLEVATLVLLGYWFGP